MLSKPSYNVETSQKRNPSPDSLATDEVYWWHKLLMLHGMFHEGIKKNNTRINQGALQSRDNSPATYKGEIKCCGLGILKKKVRKEKLLQSTG